MVTNKRRYGHETQQSVSSCCRFFRSYISSPSLAQNTKLSAILRKNKRNFGTFDRGHMVGGLMQQLGGGSSSRTQIAAACISRMFKVAVAAEIDTSWEEGTGGFSTCNVAAVAKERKTESTPSFVHPFFFRRSFRPGGPTSKQRK